MIYSELLQRLSQFGVVQISRQTTSQDDFAIIGREGEAIFPHPIGTFQTLYLENGDETEVHSEEIKAILRKFDIDENLFNLSLDEPSPTS